MTMTLQTNPDIVYCPLLEDTWDVEPGSVHVVQRPDPSYKDVFINESVYSSKGRYIIEGKCQHAGLKNKNGRTYPLRVIKNNIVENVETRSRMNNRSLFGECDHPKEGKTELKRVSHLVTGMELKEDGSVWGKFEILDTPNGQIIKTLLEAGTLPGFSSRGSGSVNKVTNEVQEDYKFQTIDIVSDPSTPGAEVARHPHMGTSLTSDPTPREAAILSRDNERSSMSPTIPNAGPIMSRLLNPHQKLAADVNLTPFEVANILSEAKRFTLNARAAGNLTEDRKVEAVSRLFDYEVLVDRCAASSAPPAQWEEVFEDVRSLRQELEESLSGVFGDTPMFPEQILVEGYEGDFMSTAPGATVNFKEALQEAQRTAVMDRDNQILNASLGELQEAYGQLSKRYEASQKVISEITDRYRNLEAQAQDAAKRVEVSEGIIEALAEKYENLQKQALEESGSVSVFETREQAAASIIESAVRRIRSMEAIIEELGKRVVAGEKLCEAMAVQIRNSILINEQENLVNSFPIVESRESVRKVLEKASTVAEMRESYEALTSTLTEQRQTSQPRQQTMVEQHQQVSRQITEQRQPVPTPATRQQIVEQQQQQRAAAQQEGGQVSMALMLESKLRGGRTLNG